MKKLIHSLILILIVSSSFSQTYISMRPNWTFNPPKAENETYEYYVSKGVGKTEKEARTDAFVLAVKEAKTRVGIRVDAQEIFKAFQTSDIDFNVVANSFKIPMKEVCVFSEKSRDDSQWYYYQLLQVAINGNITPNFRQFTGDCYDFSKAKELREIMKEEYKEKIEEDKKRQEQETKAKRKQQLRSNLYWEKGKYVAWNIAGTGYPWNLTDGVELRYGGIIGIGAYLDVGMDFTTIRRYNNNFGRYEYDKTNVFFHYDGGIKFYLYKGIFLDCGYGTINVPTGELNYYKTWDGDTKRYTNVTTNSHGFLFHAGYNLVTSLRYGTGFFLSLSAGASYDMINKVFAPSVVLKIGIAWEVGN